jgi:RND family efflux transporter MFP subunit
MTVNRESHARASTARTVGKPLVTLALTALALAGGYVIYQKVAAKPAAAAQPPSEAQRTPVVVIPAAMRDFERTVLVQGNVEAKNTAVVSPRIKGTIEAIFVDEGDTVTAGQTKLFRTDAVKLEENVQISEHDLTVAQCARRQAQAGLEKTLVDLNKARLDYERFERLHAKQAVTDDAFEQQQSRYEQLQAAEKLAMAQVDLATAQESRSQAALAIAQKDLADATIVAPISGRVSERVKEPGEMGDTGQTVVRIDDTSVLEIVAYLPAQYYVSVIPGQTMMRIQVSGIDVGRRPITYKSPTIHPKLRTFEIKCVLNDPPEGVAPGAMAQITVVFETRHGLGVPSASLQERGGRPAIFVIRDDEAQQEAVTTGIEADGWTEIREGQVVENEPIVTLGQNMLNHGTAVRVHQEEK